MITAEYAADIMARSAGLRDWLAATGRTSKSGWSSYKHEDAIAAGINPPTDAELSSFELFEFCRAKPDRYFLYISEPIGLATTWTGEKLGRVTFGRAYRDNFGGTRVPVWVKAVNGCSYFGTHFKSAGDYARVRKVKS
jgi:hypothetical protein